ncbi:hypothetical protein FPZ42_07720 [Mucilaginibacter achroorhodeus]|uniref:Uncharacterized protein n=1 Tax=Mucilaginibacter achroorhodeus TaxID=2599294 RepID=A0A563U6H0_9SPHI|nr:hypothetical protein [Mucilaginibacter achroorhodeus]TWR26914.1 hypothetical protein FPZ42_07720 [Mucilaginibacter achroorhodeus]
MFHKGQQKTGGRKKGTKNKTTQEIRDAIQLVLSDKVDQLAEDLAKMDKFKQWTILNAVAKYVLPTLNKNDDTVEHTGEININISFEDIDHKNDADE